jgi:hypothetical protein
MTVFVRFLIFIKGAFSANAESLERLMKQKNSPPRRVALTLIAA